MSSSAMKQPSFAIAMINSSSDGIRLGVLCVAPSCFLPLDPRRSALLTLYPCIHFNLEEIELHRAVFQNLVMEGADVKLGAQSFLGFGTDGGDLELPAFVGESLGRPSDVPIDLQACARLAPSGVLHHKVQRLSLDQFLRCSPTSTTNRTARNNSEFKRPKYCEGSLYSPSSKP